MRDLMQMQSRVRESANQKELSEDDEDTSCYESTAQEEKELVPPKIKARKNRVAK